MKTAIKIVLAILFVSISHYTAAQTFKNETKDATLSGFKDKAAQQNFLSNQETVVVTEASLNDNAVFISQIGDGNEVNSNTTSNESEVNFLQIGNSNIATINLRSDVIKESIFQLGNNHSVLDVNVFKNASHNIQVNQSGNNQNLTLFGSNSISEKLKVSMQGQNQTIIVRNFN
jgi:hypothetical protein